MFQKISVILLSLLFIPFSVFAGGDSIGLSVSPQKYELDVFPGESFDYKLEIKNLSDLAMPVKIRMADFNALDDTGEMIFSEAESVSSQWFGIDNSEIILSGKEKREVSFSFSIPNEAERGGYYNVMIFEPQMPSYYFKEGRPKAIPVVGVLFLISVKNLSIDSEEEFSGLQIVEFSIPKEERAEVLEKIAGVFSSRGAASVQSAYNSSALPFAEKTPSSFSVKIKNNDYYHLKSSGKIVIYDIFGNKAGETDLSQKTILPGRTRLFKSEFLPEMPGYLKWLPASISSFFLNNFFIGQYQAEVTMQGINPVSGENSGSTQKFSFAVFAWKFWLPLFIIAVLALVLRKRIGKAILALIKK
ncbi:MAG: hypothetical protein WC322_00840 [Candidatus Paceibacterota bacterium]|jgi:hypothetical protein|nr:hypothetical protein [Candidatus Paceibacterota bacterium]MDD4830808.1 hypothetical protein [Candidatus Paceibacterota bacterium]MDD4875269.1 hypothetical protein [Candidatus Paceibacterota bacterium]